VRLSEEEIRNRLQALPPFAAKIEKGWLRAKSATSPRPATVL
jgi:hypothetical protein